jgi:hypothetical protein
VGGEGGLCGNLTLGVLMRGPLVSLSVLETSSVLLNLCSQLDYYFPFHQIKKHVTLIIGLISNLTQSTSYKT